MGVMIHVTGHNLPTRLYNFPMPVGKPSKLILFPGKEDKAKED